MEHLPEWLSNLLFAALGGLGALALGLLRARVDNRKADLIDRSEFTQQVLALLTQEREHFERRLKSRDVIIKELRQRIAHLERLSNHGQANTANGSGIPPELD